MAMGSEIADLIITSPPYPMVAMWDDLFSSSHPGIRSSLSNKFGKHAHQLMLHTLIPILRASERILKPGGFLCINIGDAIRNINGVVSLYDNHSFISQYLESKTSIYQLPRIIWRKTTNAPNKFMGSGTLPLKAYVTLEHEFILIFKKPGEAIDKKREDLRRKSSIFWEERNTWYSDVWTFSGVRQDRNGHRTAAFPIELPHRLINMFSVQGDLVVDPFLGSGTTMVASLVNARNFIGFEINNDLHKTILEHLKLGKILSQQIPKERVLRHKEFLKATSCKYESIYGPVKSKQEINMRIPILKTFKVASKNEFLCGYKYYRET